MVLSLSGGITKSDGEFDICSYANSICIEEYKELQTMVESVNNITKDSMNPMVNKYVTSIRNMQTRSMLIAEKAVKGHRILDYIFKAFERLDSPNRWPRSPTQVKGSMLCLASLCWHFFEESIYDQMKIIMKRLNVFELSRWYFAEWPRRAGKTMQMCLLCAAILYVAPGETILVYSNGKRASDSFRAKVLEMLLYLCNYDNNCFDVKNKECLIFKTVLGGGKSIIKCFPSNPDVSVNILPSFHHSIILLFFLSIENHKIGYLPHKKKR